MKHEHYIDMNGLSDWSVDQINELRDVCLLLKEMEEKWRQNNDALKQREEELKELGRLDEALKRQQEQLRLKEEELKGKNDRLAVC